jgi:hypothetical protein
VRIFDSETANGFPVHVQKFVQIHLIDQWGAQVLQKVFRKSSKSVQKSNQSATTGCDVANTQSLRRAKRLHYVAWYEVKRRSNDLENEFCICPQALEVEHYLVTISAF